MYIFFANTKLVSHIPCVSIDDVSYDAISYYIREKEEELEFEWLPSTESKRQLTCYSGTETDASDCTSFITVWSFQFSDIVLKLIQL